MTANAMHICESSERYTPSKYIEAARRAMGSIALDPASNAFVNENLVKAGAFFSIENSGLENDWYGTVFVNPPSQVANEGKKGNGPKLFWKRLTDQLRAGNITAGVYLGYSLSQFLSLQNSGSTYHPLDFLTCLVKPRIKFLALSEETGEFIVFDRPTHANFITLVTQDEGMKKNFVREFSKFGKIVHPSHPQMSYPFDII